MTRQRSAALAFVLFLAALPAFAEHGESEHNRPRANQGHVVGVVSGVDVVGSRIEVRTNESFKQPHRISFLVARETTFRAGRAASISDLRVGDEVTVTYFPARVPHTAERVEVMR